MIDALLYLAGVGVAILFIWGWPRASEVLYRYDVIDAKAREMEREV